MKAMNWLRSLSVVAVATCVVAAAVSLSANASPKVSASVVELSGTINDGVGDATFKISVTNGEASDMTAFFVIFEDESSILIGDIAAGKTGLSDAINKRIDLAGRSSRNAPLKVTLKFTFEGATVEVPYGLSLSAK